MIYISPIKTVRVGGLDRIKYIELVRENYRRNQSRRDSNQSWEISHNHKRYPCKNSNQCRVCSSIRHLVRALKHNANPEHENKKCPLCHWKKEGTKESYWKYTNTYESRLEMYKNNNKIILKYLYRNLLTAHGTVPVCRWVRNKMCMW